LHTDKVASGMGPAGFLLWHAGMVTRLCTRRTQCQRCGPQRPTTARLARLRRWTPTPPRPGPPRGRPTRLHPMAMQVRFFFHVPRWCTAAMSCVLARPRWHAVLALTDSARQSGAGAPTRPQTACTCAGAGDRGGDPAAAQAPAGEPAAAPKAPIKVSQRKIDQVKVRPSAGAPCPHTRIDHSLPVRWWASDRSTAGKPWHSFNSTLPQTGPCISSGHALKDTVCASTGSLAMGSCGCMTACETMTWMQAQTRG